MRGLGEEMPSLHRKMSPTATLLVSVLVVTSGGWPVPQPDSTDLQLFNSLSQQEKLYFLRLHLADALMAKRSPRHVMDYFTNTLTADIPGETKLKLKEMSSKMSPDFSTRLYDYVVAQHSLSDRALKQLLKGGRSCNGHGSCIVLGDIGSNCCYLRRYK